MNDDEQAIRDLIATWLRASAAGDTETVLRLMADDVVFLLPGRPPMCGKATFAAGQTALKDFRLEGNSEIQEIQVSGDWAYCWTKLTVVVTPLAGGAPIKRRGNTLSVYRKQSGKWLLYRDANLLTVVQD
jgi:uncharacterized protein (TIGR02246 family)